MIDDGASLSAGYDAVQVEVVKYSVFEDLRLARETSRKPICQIGITSA